MLHVVHYLKSYKNSSLISTDLEQINTFIWLNTLTGSPKKIIEHNLFQDMLLQHR